MVRLAAVTSHFKEEENSFLSSILNNISFRIARLSMSIVSLDVTQCARAGHDHETPPSSTMIYHQSSQETDHGASSLWAADSNKQNMIQKFGITRLKYETWSVSHMCLLYFTRLLDADRATDTQGKNQGARRMQIAGGLRGSSPSRMKIHPIFHISVLQIYEKPGNGWR